jgi:hypothetical protein
MNPVHLLIHLETPYAKYSEQIPAKDVVLAGLRSQSGYWTGLAIAWIEQGALIDKEIQDTLDDIAKRKHFAQSLRHKAFALARRWERSNA